MLLLGALFLTTLPATFAQRLPAATVVEGGILQPVGFIPPRPANGELTLPYLLGDSVYVRSATGRFHLTATKTARTPTASRVNPTSSNRQSTALRFGSVARFKKTTALPEPPTGWYAQGVDTAGRYTLITRSARYVLATGSVSPLPSGNACANGPRNVNGNNPLTAYAAGGGQKIDTDWTGGTAPFGVVIRNAGGQITYTETSPDRVLIGGAVAATGTSTLTITDANGCSVSATVSTDGTPPPVNGCTNGPGSLNGGNPLSSYTSGGNPVVDLSWSNGTAPFLITVANAQGTITYTESSTDRIVIAAPVAPTGTTTVTVTDANGCTLTGTLSMGNPVAGNCSNGPAGINNGNALTTYVHSGSGQRVLDTSWASGTAPFTVVIRNASNQVVFTENSDDRIIIGAAVGGTGTSVLTITDANGCSVSANITVP